MNVVGWVDWQSASARARPVPSTHRTTLDIDPTPQVSSGELGVQSDQAPTAQVRMLDGHKKVLQGLDVGGMVTPAATHIELGT